MRVGVWRNRNEYLGEGTFVGHVLLVEAYEDIYGKTMTDEALLGLCCSNILKFSERTGVKVPDVSFEIWKEMFRKDFYIHTTPKIILDSGKTVYGCQIWWKELKVAVP